MKLNDLNLKISVGKNKSKQIYTVQHYFKGLLPESLKELENLNLFSGESGQQFIDNEKKVIYIGLGEKENSSLEKIAGSYIKLGEQVLQWKEVGLNIEITEELSEKFGTFALVYQISNSLQIGAFPVNVLAKSFKEKQKEQKPGDINFSLDTKEEKFAQKAIERSNIVSRYLNGTRLVEHLPANHFTPEEFVLRSKEIAKENKLKLVVFDKKRLEKEGFGGILAVAQGSDKSPKMIILEYNPKDAITKNKFAIIGKGLTFDSGGISIKPSADMHEMKYDMCGAATAIHAIGAIAKLGIKIPVIAAIGVAENMPDASAIKPGDVYTAYNGTTVEVQNTDAEGRLVLGDVLSYVCKHYQPEYMVDLATLTGAIIIALGHEAAGVMCNSQEFIDLIQKASESSLDKIWQMPLWEEYGVDLKSDIADIRNITGGRTAGSLSAAQFLKKFVEPNVKWAHIDIAGTAWRSKSSGTQCSGATGYGIRLLVDLALELEKTFQKDKKID